MNHRSKRRAKRMNLRPEVIRHKQREKNRAKLHQKLNRQTEKEQFVSPPASESKPLFPVRETEEGIKIVCVGEGIMSRARKFTPPVNLTPAPIVVVDYNG